MIVGLVSQDIGLPDAVKRALAFIQNTNFNQIEDGEHPIEGELMFAQIRRKRTRPHGEVKLEAHKRYIDLHYMIEGEECLYWCPRTDADSLIEDYAVERDLQYFEPPQGVKEMEIELGGQRYAVFFPYDLHRPTCDTKLRGSRNVRKLVIKIDVALLHD